MESTRDFMMRQASRKQVHTVADDEAGNRSRYLDDDSTSRYGADAGARPNLAQPVCADPAGAARACLFGIIRHDSDAYHAWWGFVLACVVMSPF